MSCTSTLAKEYSIIKMENSTPCSNAQTNGEYKDSLLDDHQKANLESSSKDMMSDHQTVDLFKKYLLPKTPHYNIGKTNEEESQAIKRAPPRPLVPLKFNGGVRCPSSLELALLPGISRHAPLRSPTPSGSEKASTSQLTIFYAGEVHVYDDVPLHKAQATMLLAGENSSLAPVVANIRKADEKKPLRPTNLPSVCKLQADLPIARRRSLQRFFKKRHDRITNRSPYISSEAKQDENDESNATDELNERGKFTPSPFPSRLGYAMSGSTASKAG